MYYFLGYILIGMIVSGAWYHFSDEEDGLDTAMFGLLWPISVVALVFFVLFYKIPRLVYRLCRGWDDLW